MPPINISAKPIRVTTRLLRLDQAAAIVGRSCSTIRYHARKRSWQKSRGLVREDDVMALKAYLDGYYINPFDPSCRRRTSK